MSVKIALAGNPNCGKTTLFNALTGSNQFVGNWPGVTVEKKEGRLKGQKDVVIMDLPGIYSLSPYTLEEVVARNYLIHERPDAILNIVDGTNLERNLYLSTQLMELGIPVVMAVNMADILRKTGDEINYKHLEKQFGCEIVEISALKGTGIQEAADKAVKLAKNKKVCKSAHSFSSSVEKVLDEIESKIGNEIPVDQKRFFAIKLFERDQKIIEKMKTVPNIESLIANCEKEMEDDAESIITNERYEFISAVMEKGYIKKSKEKLSTSDKIDRVLTHRVLGLPIFAAIMFLVYYIAVTTVGGFLTDTVNDGVFGDGFHLFGIGTKQYTEAAEEFTGAAEIIEEYENYVAEYGKPAKEFSYIKEDEETLATEEVTVTLEEVADAKAVLAAYNYEEPDPADYGVWVPGVPVVVEAGLDAIGCVDWLKGLILNGIIAGVGAVLGFVPQMLVLFIMLAFLEACGYMARIAFVLDRVFRKFGLSGKSFIPILIGTGCGVPGVMASRTIENEKDRRMTIMTTTFIPCGAKLPFIAMVAGAIFGGAAWVAPAAYFMGIAVIICSGIILKKTKVFAGDPAPFVMELPPYHMPTVGNVLRSMWERGWSFIKKAGTIILLSTIVIWFLSYFGVVDGQFMMLEEDQLDSSILAAIGHAISWIFIPLGFGNWQAAVASITGLVAKENIVGTMGILYRAGAGTVYQNMAATFTAASGFAFLAFNLLCAPCFAALGAIKREMNNRKWFWAAFGWQMLVAYCVGLCVNQIGNLFVGGSFGFGSIAAILVIVVFLYFLVRPDKYKRFAVAKA